MPQRCICLHPVDNITAWCPTILHLEAISMCWEVGLCRQRLAPLGRKGQEAAAHPRRWRSCRSLRQCAWMCSFVFNHLTTGRKAAYCDCQQGDKRNPHVCRLQRHKAKRTAD